MAWLGGASVSRLDDGQDEFIRLVQRSDDFLTGDRHAVRADVARSVTTLMLDSSSHRRAVAAAKRGVIAHVSRFRCPHTALPGMRGCQYSAGRPPRPREDAGPQRFSFPCQRRRGAMAWPTSRHQKRGGGTARPGQLGGQRRCSALVSLGPWARHGGLAGVRRAGPRSHRRPRSRVGRREAPATGWWRRIGPSGAAPRYRCQTATGRRSRSCRARAGCAAA